MEEKECKLDLPGGQVKHKETVVCKINVEKDELEWMTVELRPTDTEKSAAEKARV